MTYDWIDPFIGRSPDETVIAEATTGKVTYSGPGTIIGISNFYLTPLVRRMEAERMDRFVEDFFATNDFLRALRGRRGA